MPLDIARVRGLFPTLSGRYLHLQGADGALVPESVARAITAALRVPLSERGGVFPSSRRADALLEAARTAVADLLGGDASRVVLAPNPTILVWSLARALSRRWDVGDELVLSRLDRSANLEPWLMAARSAGAVVRWAEVDVESCDLPAWQFDELLTDRTVLVSVPAASSAVGTSPELAAIAERAHRVGALVFADATHAVPHLPVDADSVNVDLFLADAARWGGPHVTAVVVSPQAYAQLEPERSHRQPQPLEAAVLRTGDVAWELLAGLVASVDHLAALDEAATGSRRDRVLVSMDAVWSHESALHTRLAAELQAMPGVTVLGDPELAVPIVSFTMANRSPRAVAEELARRGICAWDGMAGAPELMEALGVAEVGGVLRVGLMHYNTGSEVDQFLAALADLR